MVSYQADFLSSFSQNARKACMYIQCFISRKNASIRKISLYYKSKFPEYSDGLKQMAQKQTYHMNPFTEKMWIETSGKRTSISTTKKGNVPVNYIETDTGEVSRAVICSYKEVDNEPFIKIYTNQIASVASLSVPGKRVFEMFMFLLQKKLSKDEVYLNDYVRSEFLEENPSIKSFSKSTMYLGIDSLIAADIVAPSAKQNIYFINPSVIFNGNRLTLMTEIVNKGSSL